MADGAQYDGEWKMGNPHGQGVWQDPGTGATFDGLWENGNRIEGKLTTKDGKVY